MKILVTGASGFLGQSLVPRLIREGKDVLILTRKKIVFENELDANKIKQIIYSDETGFQLDSNDQPQIIIHLATYFVSNHSESDLKKLVDANILLGMRVLEYSKQNKIDVISTSSFAQSLDGFSDTPQNLYALTKKIFEDLLVFYSKEYKVKVINLELFDTYGPGDIRRKVVNLAIESFRNGDEFKMSSGDQEICLLNVEDVINGLVICLNQLPELEGYNAFTLLNKESTFKLKDLILEIKEILKSSSLIKLGHYPYRKNEIFELHSKHVKLSNWKSKITLTKGITKKVDYENK
jgi:nucleoside-diphosphate-sugar epimerase